jgi:hypothetical protein
MEKSAPKKLTLSRETLHTLEQMRLGLVVGGQTPHKGGGSTLDCTQ